MLASASPILPQPAKVSEQPLVLGYDYREPGILRMGGGRYCRLVK